MTHLFGGSYTGRRAFITGHTGFKGSWLTLWLRSLGADVTGYSLPPPTVPSMFDTARVGDGITHIEADVRDAARLREALVQARPDVVFHLAAQAIVRVAYEQPRETLDANVMGTANLLEAVRAHASAARPCAVVVITSDKCYENHEWVHGYREIDRLGGDDPYSMSKAAAELVVASWRRTFFPVDRIDAHGVRLATARAGNVIGGGDWAVDRVVPDCLAALTAGRPIAVRNPDAIRPWQHVLESLGGYLHLAARLLASEPAAASRLCEAWNFGPTGRSVWAVRQLVDRLVAAWGSGDWKDCSDPGAPHEARLLALSSDKAFHHLGWAPVWDVDTAVVKTVSWAKSCSGGADDMRAVTLRQVAEYVSDATAAGASWTAATGTGNAG